MKCGNEECGNEAVDILILSNGERLDSCRECTREAGNSNSKFTDIETKEEAFVQFVK